MRALFASLLFSAMSFVAACGTSSEGGSGDSDAGADSGGGGTGGTGLFGGASGTGAGGTIGGTAGCGPCLRIACGPPISLIVTPEGASPISDLTVDVEGVTVSCSAIGTSDACQWNCSTYQPLPTGHHTATVSAPGFESQTIEFDVNNPTNCGCCGCPCGGSFQTTIALRPTGAPVPGCCAALATDRNNCGACGRTCSLQSCIAGKCGPAFGQCLAGGGPASCDAFCEDLGLGCVAACGTNGDQAMLEWVGGVANCGGDPNVTPRSGTCSEPFATGGAARADYQCCCEEL